MEAVDLRSCMGKTLIRLHLIYRSLLLGWRRWKDFYIKMEQRFLTWVRWLALETRLQNGKEMRGAFRGYKGLYLLLYSCDCVSVIIRLEQACSTRLMLPTAQCCVARGNIWNDEMPFSHFPGKAEIERQSIVENLWAVYLWRHTNSFCKGVPKLWITLFNKYFLLLSVQLHCTFV